MLQVTAAPTQTIVRHGPTFVSKDGDLLLAALVSRCFKQYTGTFLLNERSKNRLVKALFEAKLLTEVELTITHATYTESKSILPDELHMLLLSKLTEKCRHKFAATCRRFNRLGLDKKFWKKPSIPHEIPLEELSLLILRHGDKIKTLELTNTLEKWTAESQNRFLKLLPWCCPHLTCLDLSYNFLGSEIEVGPKTLTELNLSGNRIETVPDSLKGLTQLKKFELEHNLLRLPIPIVEALPNLEILNLKQNPIGNGTAIELAKMVENHPALLEINLEDTRIRESGVVAFATVQEKRDLTIFW